MRVIGDWFRRHFSDPQVVILAGLLVFGTLVILALGKMLAPVLASVVIAYLLEGLVGLLSKYRMPRLAAVLIVFVGFMLFLAFLLFGLLPLLWRQFEQLFQELPSKISWSQQALLRLPERYPDIITEQQVLDIIDVLRSELTNVGQRILSFSFRSVRSLFWIVLYAFLVPLMVFFFLKDRERLTSWVQGLLPEHRRLATEVWSEVDRQIGNYVRGKVWEILIVWSASYLTYSILGLQYAMLISLFIGLSVLVPYFGAIFMFLPLAWVGYYQWGLSADFAYALIAYIIIQILDGNVLVALLFSEVVNLHPIAIVVSVLVFGGLWGFWGVFFAIPLATLVQAILKVWAGHRRKGADALAETESQGADTGTPGP